MKKKSVRAWGQSLRRGQGWSRHRDRWLGLQPEPTKEATTIEGFQQDSPLLPVTQVTLRQMITAGTLSVLWARQGSFSSHSRSELRSRLSPQEEPFPQTRQWDSRRPQFWLGGAGLRGPGKPFVLGLGFFIKKAEFLSNLPFPTLTSQHRYETTDRCFGECKSYKCTVFYSSVNFHVNQIRKSAMAPGKH